MIRPDFREFKHSAKGSEWEKHKYLKRDKKGYYYYPDSYEGGRHLPKGEKATGDSEEKKSKKESDEGEEKDSETGKASSSGGKTKTSSKKSDSKNNKESLASKNVSQLAAEVIKGTLGKKENYKALLGSKYEAVQERAKEIAQKAKFIESRNKYDPAAKAREKNKGTVRAPQKEVSKKSKEEADEEERARILQGKTIVKTDKKEEPETRAEPIRKSEEKSRAEKAMEFAKKDANKMLDDVVKKNSERLLDEELRKISKSTKSTLDKVLSKVSGSSSKSKTKNKSKTKTSEESSNAESEKKESSKTTSSTKKKSTTTAKTKSIDISQILSVYDRKKKRR